MSGKTERGNGVAGFVEHLQQRSAELPARARQTAEGWGAEAQRCTRRNQWARCWAPSSSASRWRGWPVMSSESPAAWSRALARQTQEHPRRTVALTVGAGFILGGGLFSPLTARIAGLGLRLGLRVLTLPIVIEGLGAYAAGVLMRDGDAPDAPSESRPETTQRRRTHEAQ